MGILDFLGGGSPPSDGGGLLSAPLRTIFGAGSGHGQTDDIKEFEYARRNGGFTGNFADWMVKKRAANGQYGLQPIWGVDKDGNPSLIQLSNAGQPIQPQLPAGFQISNKPIKIDAGTHEVLIDPQTRAVIGTIPKNVQEVAQQREFGKEQGAAKGSQADLSSKMPGLEAVIAKLDDLAKKATYTTAGKVVDYARKELTLPPREAAVARTDYEATVSNQILPLLRQTFGAQFTQKEGETLAATLGAPDKTPEEKQAVLKSFLDQKKRDLDALGVRTGTALQPAIDPRAINALKKDPKLRDQFDAKYGKGAATSVLGQ